jgi:sigma-E factor negative regulatory protein RseA
MSTSAQPSPDDEPRSRLSAAADGDPAALAATCRAWRLAGQEGDEARRTWHTYHLIGDVMRSSELARRPARDQAFLEGLRERLAQEPVVLAPAPAVPAAPAAPAARPMPRWWVPAAAAAGFVAVAGVVVVMQAGPGSSPAPQLAAAPLAPAAATATAPTPPAGTAVLIRDERLDEFLRAHQAARGGMGAALPGGAIRRVELEAPAPR